MEKNLQSHSFLITYWIAISSILVVADFFAGPFLQFPVTYLIPVAFASWYNGKWWGLAFSIILPLIRFYFNTEFWTVPWTLTEATINLIIRVVVLGSFAIVIDRTSLQTRRLSKEVQILEGLLPICSYCKKIRDGENEWQPIEKFITKRSDAKFSHGMCPECLKREFGDVFSKKTS